MVPILGVREPVNVRKGARCFVTGLRNESDLAYLSQAGCLVVMGPEHIHFVEWNEHVGASQDYSAQVLPAYGASFKPLGSLCWSADALPSSAVIVRAAAIPSEYFRFSSASALTIPCRPPPRRAELSRSLSA